MTASSSHAARPAGNGLALLALGVIFGDIGTSPLYTMREAFSEAGLDMSPRSLYGVLSMIFWSITVIVTAKYVLLMLRFDYRGEGGVLALLSLTLSRVRDRPMLARTVTGLGMFAAALFFGDAMITPAISLLSAVEGISVVAPSLHDWVVPVALVILVSLFAVQSRGTAMVGKVFGPVMLVWFFTLAMLGLVSVLQNPEVLVALDPEYAWWLFNEHPSTALIALGAVFLCITGAEAMYADLGHFGRTPIRRAWFAVVFPSLVLNYFGQGAMLLRTPEAASNPFYLLAPESLRIPLVILATLATIIASQAVISGAFSVVQQASRLNLLPRLKVSHTSETTSGQIYIPLVNGVLLCSVLALVIGFGESGALAAAYGLAVSGDFVIGTVLLALLILTAARRSMRWLLIPLALFMLLEIAFLAANLRKFFDGGWFPLLIALVLVFLMATWRGGIESLRMKKEGDPRALVDGLAIDLTDVIRVPGSAVFFSSSNGGCPTSFLHNLKHNKVVHENTYFLTVNFLSVPRLNDDDERLVLTRGDNGIYRLVAHFGYREDPDIGLILRLARAKGLELHEEFTSFFVSKPVIVSIGRSGARHWQRRIFGGMLQNSPSVANYLRLPPNRVIEVGAQVAL